MRKKKHFRINATDKQFDRFFVINYAKAPGEGGGETGVSFPTALSRQLTILSPESVKT